MESDKLKDILIEMCEQIEEINPGLPKDWIKEMIKAIQSL